MKEVFTTGQVAKICNVAVKTVVTWFESGEIEGFTIPGSQDRRIPRKFLIRFLKKHGMPLGTLEDEEKFRILFLGKNDETSRILMENQPAFEIEYAANSFDFGMRYERGHFKCLLVDMSRISLRGFIPVFASIKRIQEDKKTIILLEPEIDSCGLEEVKRGSIFRRPFDPVLLGETINRVMQSSQVA